MIATAVLTALLSSAAAMAAATSPPDALTNHGPGTVKVPFSRLYGFVATCHAIPCRIQLVVASATAGGHRIRGLFKATPAYVMTKPSGVSVWLVPKEFNAKLLHSTLTRYGSVRLQLAGTLVDANGAKVIAKRTVTLRP